MGRGRKCRLHGRDGAASGRVLSSKSDVNLSDWRRSLCRYERMDCGGARAKELAKVGET